MHAAPARYVSVSELYSTDEVELLLDEIRELEPTSCRGEDVQDFEIAGSGFGCGAAAGGVGGAGGAGGRSPAGTELTERSWDSHAHYSREPPPQPRAVAPLYCHARHLWSLRGATALLVLLCGGGCACCVWAVCGVRLWLLPLAARVRLLQLAALTSALLHAALLLAHVTRLHALLPLPWPRLHLAAALWAVGSLCSGGALTLHAVLAAPEYRWAPPHIASLLLAAAGLALCGGGFALVVSARELFVCWRSRSPDGGGGPTKSRSASLRAAYRAVPTAPPPAAPQPAPGPSSRDDAL